MPNARLAHAQRTPSTAVVGTVYREPSGDSENIPETFGEPSANLRGILWEPSENLWETFGELPGNLRGTFGKPIQMLYIHICYQSRTNMVAMWYESAINVVRIWYLSGTNLVPIWYESGTNPV